MPQANDQERNLMIRFFGGIDDYPIIQFLESRGYVLTKKWFWEPPVPSHTISFEEAHCLDFLVDEWDFGHITKWTGKWQSGKCPHCGRICGAGICT